MSETRLTPERRAELARLCEAATAGPWRDDMHGYTWGPNDAMVADECHACEGVRIRGVGGRLPQKANAAFIAAARTALPEALAEVDRLTARWEALKVNIDAPAVVCSFRGDAYEQALLDVVREMTRLEQEP